MNGSLRVMVVDDEEVVLASVEKLLQDSDMDVLKVGSAEEAIFILGEQAVDVVITDLRMPGVDGLELLRLIRDGGYEVPTILITGYASVRSAVQALKLGAVEYLPKPFTRSELRGAVRRASRRSTLPERPVATPRASSVYRLPEHAWVRIEDDGNVLVGMDFVLAHTIGTLSHLDLPTAGETVEQGRACLMATDEEGISHFVASPLGGRVVELNDLLLSDPRRVLDDPEGAGWLLRLEPADLEKELKNLVPD